MRRLRRGRSDGRCRTSGRGSSRASERRSRRTRSAPPPSVAGVGGARAPLIAFNVNLGTPDVQVAKKIAHAIRESSGGLKYVRAKGFALKDQIGRASCRGRG